MGKVLSILIGLVLMALGVWGVVDEGWRTAVIAFVQGGLVILALLVGLGVFVFGLSELRASAEEPPVMEPPSAEKPAGEESSQSE